MQLLLVSSLRLRTSSASLMWSAGCECLKLKRRSKGGREVGWCSFCSSEYLPATILWVASAIALQVKDQPYSFMSQSHKFHILNSTLLIVCSIIFLSAVLPRILACDPGKWHPTKLFSSVGHSINNWNQWTLGYYTARSGRGGEGGGGPERWLCSCLSLFLFFFLFCYIHYNSRILQLFMINIWQALSWNLTDDLSQNCISAYVRHWLTKWLWETFLSCCTDTWKFSFISHRHCELLLLKIIKHY